VSQSWAVFLDKDGTLVRDVPYNADPARMQFAPGAEEALRRLATLRAPLVVVSNQPAVALRRCAIADMKAVERRLQAMFDECGARLAAFYFCPHHPEGVDPLYRLACRCRKPRPGLLLRAARQLGVDLAGSWMVGDILDDVEAGRRAGCRTVLIDNGNETVWRSGPRRTPHHVVGSAAEAAHLILAAA
jgi:histidinol-phosphate phosphatase family protein